MTVYEFMRMFLEEDEQYFKLWDNEKEKYVFEGYLPNLPYELCIAEVTSIDNIANCMENSNGIIILNVDI